MRWPRNPPGFELYMSGSDTLGSTPSGPPKFPQLRTSWAAGVSGEGIYLEVVESRVVDEGSSRPVDSPLRAASVTARTFVQDSGRTRPGLRVVAQEVENGPVCINACNWSLAPPEVAEAHRGRDPLENRI